ncbi:histone methylation protein DOT1-domain-containing protein [Scheffersomyces amazonensis]|uniref:histone methylation protein DOT1-domain-containing protein n=1 Tax=Scheffersomyces amazonensis TaxID=1078765 RepID=UPI00315D4D6E
MAKSSPMFSPPHEAQTPDTSDHDHDHDHSSDDKDQSTNSEVFDNQITFSQLLKIHRPITEAVKFIKQKQQKEMGTWKYKCLLYAYLYRKDLTNKEIGLLSKFPSINDYVCDNFTQGLKLSYSKKFTKVEIQTLFLIILHDSTKIGMEKYLPTKSLQDIEELVYTFFPKFFCNESELKAYNLALQGEYTLEQLFDLLPLRDKNFIKGKLTSIDGDWKSKVHRESTSDLQQVKSKPIKKEIKRIKKEPMELKRIKSIDKEQLQREKDIQVLLLNDLTLEAIRSQFPELNINEIINEIKSRNDMEIHPFTAGEKSQLKELLDKKINNEQDIINKFPCRSLEYIQNQIKKTTFVSSRQTKFKTSSERLLYEAKWVSYSQGESNSNSLSARSKRREKRNIEQSLEQLEKDVLSIIPSQKKTKISLSPEEILRREKLKEAKRLANEKRLLEKEKLREELRKKKEEYDQKVAQGLIVPRIKREFTTELQQLMAGSEHFQSVIGDKRKIEYGQKRNRIAAVRFTNSREPEKSLRRGVSRQIQKKLIKKELRTKNNNTKKQTQPQIQIKIESKSRDKSKKRRSTTTANAKSQRKRRTIKMEIIEGEPEDEVDEIFEEPEPEEDEEVEISPYDPIDINSDSMIPLNNRYLFVSSLYQDIPSLPKINFVEVGNEQSEMSPVKQCMTTVDDKILFDDSLAAELIKDHRRSYKDLPISFPSLLDPSGGGLQVNQSNKVRIRFLLYPQHTEQFLLATPKSNELDPVYEILKLFMIHYALYFSHSSQLKKIITEDYCHGLEESIENNDFSEFMFIIDKWNELMLRLSPNIMAVENVKDKDINWEIRQYLSTEEVKQVTCENLKLSIFYSEFISEPVSPSYQLIKEEEQEEEENSKPEKKKFIPTRADEVEIPTNVLDIKSELKPCNYNESFYKRLQEMSEISRYAVQQILLRVYSRIVSTDSRKLRSYKAFTAEVYGELLPSFTSEVLEKVNLRPEQKFYDLGSGVGNTTFQAALEYGVCVSGGCELMQHASKLTLLQEGLIQKHLAVFGLQPLNLDFALSQSFVDNEKVRQSVLDCDVLIINNYLFDGQLNSDVGKLLLGIRPGTKIISLRNFISPRYRATGDTVFDYFKVEKHEMSDFLSVSWTANKVPYYISTVQDRILPEYLGKDETPEDSEPSTPFSRAVSEESTASSDLTPVMTSPDINLLKNFDIETSQLVLL